MLSKYIKTTQLRKHTKFMLQVVKLLNMHVELEVQSMPQVLRLEVPSTTKALLVSLKLML